MMRTLLTRIAAKLRNVWSSKRADKDLEREIAVHVAMLEEEYERRGMSREEARTAARRTLGGVEQAKQAHRDQRSILWLEQTRQDLRHLPAGRLSATRDSRWSPWSRWLWGWRQYHALHSL